MVQLIWEGSSIDMPFKLSAIWEVRGEGAITRFKLQNTKETSEMFPLQILSENWFIGALTLKPLH